MKFLLRQATAADVAAGLLSLLFAWVCVAFARQPGLASFADDSVSYLVMAQVFSPWQAASAPVAEAFAREAFYPPFFPALLGVLGAAHHMALAHAVTALLLAACLPLTYLLGVRWLGSRWAAAAATAVIATLPSLWINVKGILSEPLFSLLLLAAFLLLEGKGNSSRRRWGLAAVLAALALTRTVGLVVVVAYGLWAITRPDQPLAERARGTLPAIVAAAAYALWVLFRPAGTPDDYMRIVAEQSRSIFSADSALTGLAFGLLRQASSVAEAWAGSLLIFWVEGHPARLVLAGAVGLLAVAGLAIRFLAGKADAWMAVAYLATFLLWPFYDQMTRFLFPLLPILVLYAFWACAEAARRLRKPAGAAHTVLVLLLLSLSVPALAFIHQRSRAPERYAQMTDWYRTPDLGEARLRSQIHLDLEADMDAIRRITRPEDRIMWVVPSYLALLAERRGVSAPSASLAPPEYRASVVDSHADYVFLSAYHPRDTIHDSAWRAGLEALRGQTETVQTRIRGADGKLSSLLLKMNGPKQ
jgi:hypothetical protein